MDKFIFDYIKKSINFNEGDNSGTINILLNNNKSIKVHECILLLHSEHFQNLYEYKYNAEITQEIIMNSIFQSINGKTNIFELDLISLDIDYDIIIYFFNELYNEPHNSKFSDLPSIKTIKIIIDLIKITDFLLVDQNSLINDKKLCFKVKNIGFDSILEIAILVMNSENKYLMNVWSDIKRYYMVKFSNQFKIHMKNIYLKNDCDCKICVSNFADSDKEKLLNYCCSVY
jgi:hypothetical protein